MSIKITFYKPVFRDGLLSRGIGTVSGSKRGLSAVRCVLVKVKCVIETVMVAKKN